MGDTVADRVRRGAKLLDTKHPGRHRKVDLKKLNQKSSCNCVLGQVFGLYRVGVETLLPILTGIEDLDLDPLAARFGFTRESVGNPELWERLNRAWVLLIYDRQPR